MNNCNQCNSILMDKVDFKTGKQEQICLVCNNISPTDKEIINAIPYYPNLPNRTTDYVVLPDIIIPKKPFTSIIEKPLKTNSVKPNFTYVNVEIKKTTPTPGTGPTPNQQIKINWEKVIGYEEIKHIIDAALANTNKKKTHILIVGAAGTSKTVFLKTIEESMQAQNLNVHYLDATTLSSSGVIEYLFTNQVDYCLLDEIDKLEKEHQRVFLNMLESGLMQETKSGIGKNRQERIRKKDMKNTIFICTGNYIEKIMYPLLTRFLTLNIPEYTKEQFMTIGIELLNKQYGKTKEIAQYITKEVYRIYTDIRKEKPNLRNCVQVATLTNNDKNVINPILNGLTKFATRYQE